MGNITQDITIALGLKVVFLVTTILGITGLWPAILSDAGLPRGWNRLVAYQDDQAIDAKGISLAGHRWFAGVVRGRYNDVPLVAVRAGSNPGMSEIKRKSEGQKKAEAEVQSFADDLGPFVVAAEKTRMAMVFTDALKPDDPIIFANDSFLELTGYHRQEVLGQGFSFLLSNPSDAKAMALIESESKGAPYTGSEMLCRRKDGREFWAAIFVSPVRDEKGDVVQYFASFVDLTKHKQDQAESRMLINELNHRVKNTLSTVQSIVYQALRTSRDPEVIRESIESRLHALSRSHDLLTRENWKSAGLVDIVGAALEPFGVGDGRAERFSVSGKNIRFPPSSALALAIAFHELATNAVKYGAFSNDAGSISITWAIDPAPEGARVVLKWVEKDGPPVAPPSRQGFGSRVIERGLAHELEGTATLDYRPAGLVCTISIPAPHSARDE